MIALAVIGKVKEKKKEIEIVRMSTFHSISLTPTSWMIIFIIVCVKMFFSWEAIVRGGWNTTLDVKM